MMYVFDGLIQNRDRNPGNIIWTTDWKMWLIDHTRAFRGGRDLMQPKQLVRCERSFLEKRRELSADAITRAVGKNLTKDEIGAVMARRDKIVKLFDAQIAQRGEAAVLFSLAHTATVR